MKWIREWTLNDASDLAKAISNKNILNNLRDGIPYPYTEKDALEFINSTLQAPKDSQYSWAVQWKGKAIGSIGLFRQSNIHFRSAELGYYIAESYWGKGIVTSAVKEACDYVFEHTDIVRIYAEPFSRNRASCRVLEKAGFIQEGTMKKNAYKSGVFEDMELYARVREIDS